MNEIGVDLLWIPLGAGGHFVKLNGRIYEFFKARSEDRPTLELYHTALEVTLPDGCFVVENAWPIPDRNGAERGVTVEGPVGTRGLGRFRVFRYELRCWKDGTISDKADAVATVRVNDDEQVARRLLALTDSVPAYVWGRDVLGIGDMWNSNSVISFLLYLAGVETDAIRPPPGGRAPGWGAGMVAGLGRLTGSPLTMARP